MESSIVVKVKYSGTLRRFTSRIVGGKLDFDMNALSDKVHYLFSIPAATELTLTYFDDDGDVVTIADDDDLDEIGRQNRQNPLRIDVRRLKINPVALGVQLPSESSG